MLISHIGAMDCFAKALRVAAKMTAEGVMDKMKEVLKKFLLKFSSQTCTKNMLSCLL